MDEETIGSLLRDLGELFQSVVDMRNGEIDVDELEEEVRLFRNRVREAFPATQ